MDPPRQKSARQRIAVATTIALLLTLKLVDDSHLHAIFHGKRPFELASAAPILGANLAKPAPRQSIPEAGSAVTASRRFAPSFPLARHPLLDPPPSLARAPFSSPQRPRPNIAISAQLPA